MMSQSQSCIYTAEEWMSMKDVIYDIYIVQNEEFKKMRRRLSVEHNFYPSKNKFLNMLKVWGFRKYSTRESWRSLAHQVERKGLNLGSDLRDIEINGQTVPLKKLKKEIARYSRPASEAAVYTSATATPGEGLTSTSSLATFVEQDVSLTASNEAMAIAPWSTTLPLASTTSWISTPSVIPASASPPRKPRPAGARYATGQTLTPLSSLHGHATPAVVKETLSADEKEEKRRKLLTLPMFELLHALSPLLPTNFSVAYVQPSGVNNLPLLHYKWIRVYLLQAVSVTENTSDTDDMDCRDLVMKTSTGLFAQLSVTDTVRKHLGMDDAFWCAEAVLPDFQQPEVSCDVDQYTGSPMSVEYGATVFYFCYLSLNRLIQDTAFDEFFRWALSIDFVKQSLQRITKLCSPIGRHLGTQFLHSAIRVQQSQEVLVFLDARYAQLSCVLIADEFENEKMQLVSPLQTTVLSGNTEAVRLLISAGCAANCPDIDSHAMEQTCLGIADPPLCLAVRDARNTTIVDALLQNGSDASQVALQTVILSGFQWPHVQAFLDAGASLKSRNKEKDMSQDISVVHAASIRGDLEILQKLLDLGFSANGAARREHSKLGLLGHKESNCGQDRCRDKLYGSSPLMLAIKNNNINAALILVSRGADVEHIHGTENALLLAVEKQSTELVKAILESESLNTDTIRDGIVLIRAVQARDISMLMILLAYKLSFRLKYTNWKDICCEIAKAGDVGVMHSLLYGPIYNSIFNSSLPRPQVLEHALMAAAANGQMGMMQFLVKSGASVDKLRTPDGNSLLEAAARSRCFPAFAFVIDQLTLLGEGWTTEKLDERWKASALLTVAAANNQLAIVVMLLNDGGSPDGNSIVNAFFARPIVNAINYSNWNMLRKLLASGARTDVGDEHPEIFPLSRMSTLLPAEYAWTRSQPKALQIMSSFLPQGCGLRIRFCEDFWATTLVGDYPVDKESLKILLDLQEWGTDFNFKLSLTWIFKQEFESEHLADLLISHGAWLNCMNDSGVTPLRSALMNRRFDYAKKLVRIGADVDNMAEPTLPGRDSEKIAATAIEAACLQSHASSVAMLLEKSLSLGGKNFSGSMRGSLHAAVVNGYLHIVKMLLDSISDHRYDGLKNIMATTCAIRSGRVDILKLLLNDVNDPEPILCDLELAREDAISKGYFLVVDLLDEYKESLHLEKE